MTEQQKQRERIAQARDTEFWNRRALREREGFRQNEWGEWTYLSPTERRHRDNNRLLRMKPITETIQ